MAKFVYRMQNILDIKYKLEEQEKKAWEELSFSEHMAIYEAQEIPRKEAMKLVAKDRGISKRDVYQALLSEES